jgi:hypothetical protein
MKGRLFVTAVIGFICAVLTPAAAQVNHQDHAKGHGVDHGPQPAMPGQDLFGAVTEIVGILNDDPATDWTKVDIDALHAHLLDMHLVATESRPAVERIAGGVRVTLDRTGVAGTAAERMLAAHGPILQAAFGWRAVLEIDDREIQWTVLAANGSADAARIRALGFFGLLASGAHHQSHHLAIARGMGHPHGTVE